MVDGFKWSDDITYGIRMAVTGFNWTYDVLRQEKMTMADSNGQWNRCFVTPKITLACVNWTGGNSLH